MESGAHRRLQLSGEADPAVDLWPGRLSVAARAAPRLRRRLGEPPGGTGLRAGGRRSTEDRPPMAKPGRWGRRGMPPTVDGHKLSQDVSNPDTACSGSQRNSETKHQLWTRAEVIGAGGGSLRLSRTFGDRRGASNSVDRKSLLRCRFRARLMASFPPASGGEFSVIGDHQTCARAKFNRKWRLKVSGIHTRTSGELRSNR
jgi:hypothetical protein